jgi:hypothetical protein
MDRGRIERMRIATGVSLLGFLLLAGGCSSPVEETSTARGREIVPQATDGIVLARQESAGMSIQVDEERTVARIDLDEGILFISALDVNLDLDEPEEQVLAVKRADDPEDRVRLLVADFDTLRSTYRVVWEGATRATNVRTFAVYTLDLIGDHQDEIIAMGTDNEGRQTMNVYRRRQGGRHYPLLQRDLCRRHRRQYRDR